MIKVICVGKLKETYLVDACLEYLKRIGKYTHIELIELKDSNMICEKEEILKHIKFKDYVITLEILGNNISSLVLANKIDKILMINPNITFIIGGSDGLADDIKKRSNYALSFSQLTFPHQLFRVMLLEQIYRCFKILSNETYHK
ncbi:MAG: 23S rRNA (pseudouridine(1915)-N(3))-methyltransferase RlmH [Bacilli bacterium]